MSIRVAIFLRFFICVTAVENAKKFLSIFHLFLFVYSVRICYNLVDYGKEKSATRKRTIK